MSIILNIDASLETASVSFSNNGEILNVLLNEKQKEHAAFLHVAVQTLTNATGLPLSQVDAVAVTVGPGSYTGIRVGLAAAKGLSYALKKPLISLTTLQALTKQCMINNAPVKDSYYCPMIDARRMEVFTALYDADMQQLRAAEAVVLMPDFQADHLKKNSIIFFGSGAAKWKNICTNKHAFFSEIDNISEALSSLAFEKFLQKDFADIRLSSPLYVKEFFDRR